jgi:titin
VRLTWTAPSGNGSAITDYVLERSTDGSPWVTVDDGTSAATTFLVAGLMIGTPYEFRVTARNDVGAGPASEPVAVTPLWTPSAPTALTAAAAPAGGVGSGQVRLVWDAPVNDGGSAVLHYVIERSTDGATWSTVADGVSPARTFTVDGLTNGTSYRFRVRARNAAGVGPSATIRATPVWVPSAPRRISAAVAPARGVGSGHVRLSWGAPSSNGAPVTDYLIERSANGGTWTRIDDDASTATALTVTGLVNGTSYRFRIAAVNRIGRGVWAAAIQATPAWKPAPPGGLRATAASRRVTLRWNAPASNGQPITDYVIQRSVGRRAWTTVRDRVSTTRRLVITGLTNGTRYRFRVAAKNAVGTGPWSATVRAVARRG